jgi:hypothetical protein
MVKYDIEDQHQQLPNLIDEVKKTLIDLKYCNNISLFVLLILAVLGLLPLLTVHEYRNNDPNDIITTVSIIYMVVIFCILLLLTAFCAIRIKSISDNIYNTVLNITKNKVYIHMSIYFIIIDMLTLLPVTIWNSPLSKSIPDNINILLGLIAIFCMNGMISLFGIYMWIARENLKKYLSQTETITQQITDI